MYIPGDARLEGFGTVSELKARIEKLEKMLKKVTEVPREKVLEGKGELDDAPGGF